MKISKYMVLAGFLPICGGAFGYVVPNGYGAYPYATGRPAGVVVQNPTYRQNTNYIVSDNPGYRYTAQAQQQPVVKKKMSAYPKWYAGADLFYNYASFESKHLTNGVYDSSDPYSLDEFGIWQLGGDIYAGYKFNENWRLEGELGYFSKYSEGETGATYNAEFSIATPYLIANVIYDMSLRNWGGLFFGAGLGMAFPTTTIESAAFISGDAKKMEVSPMGALMVGWQYPINDQWFFNVKYRLSAYDGTSQTRQWVGINNVVYDFTNETSLVLNNALSVGVRYEF